MLLFKIILISSMSKKNVLGKTNIEVSVIGFGEAPFEY